MTIEAQLADGRVLEFPDGTDPSVIQTTVKRMLAPAPAKDAGFSFKDIGVAFGQGTVGSAEALTNVAGAGNAASQYLGDVSKSLGEQYTPERQAEMQRQQQRMKKAEESGSTFEEIKAAAQNIYEAPLQSIAQGIGSFVPYIPAIFAGPAAAALGLSSRAVAAANVVAKAYAPVVGTAQGAGAVKGAIYSTVYKAEKESGLSESEARQKATAAQDYTGKNLDQIALGAGLGYVASKGGIEKFLTKEGREKAAEKIIPRVTKAVTEESVTEGAQGGQERLASNIALQRTGRDVPTFQGVGGQAAQDAIIASLTAGAVSIPQSSKATVEDLTKPSTTKIGQEALDIVNAPPPPPPPEREQDVEPVINPPVGDSVPVVSEREIVQPPAGAIAPEGVGVGAVVPPVVPVATGAGEQPAALKPSLGEYNIGLPDELSDTFERLQNRNRASQESVTQMKRISNETDYDRLSIDPNFGSGAPVVISDFKLSNNQLGKMDVATAVDGRKVPIQYAVVSADNLLPSHTSDGQVNKTYADTNIAAIRPVAGNGRVAGLQEGYGKSSPTTLDYSAKMLADTRHGIDPNVIKATPNPVLVRIMPKTEITRNIGDISNVSAGLELSPLEKAKNDANRLDLSNVEFEETEDGSLKLNKKSATQFIQAMPENERGTMVDSKGEPNTVAMDRLRNAMFWKAYSSDRLGHLYTEATDPEAKLILSAMQKAVPKMVQLEGAGIYDVRPNVVEAAEMAVNARRKGVPLKDLVNQEDMTRDPTTQAVLEMFAGNSRSGNRMGDLLGRFADEAYKDANVVEDMFGEKPQRPLSEIAEALKPAEEEVKLATPEEKKAEEGAPPKLDESKITPKKGRHPQMQAAAKLLQEGKMTREEFEKYSDYYKPIQQVEAEKLLPPTSDEKMLETVDSGKRDKVNVPIEDGTIVGLRMDLPARERGGAVVSIHEGKPGLKTLGKLLSFKNVAHLVGGKDGRVTFEPRSQEKGLGVAIGENKAPQQTVEGKWKNVTAEAAYAKVKELMGNPQWSQIGFDPSRHGYFYDRKTREPVKSASEVYQVGQFLLAKDVEFAPKSEFLYSLRGKSEGQITAFEQSLRTLLSKFGLRDVGLKLSEGMRDEGSYAAKLIQIAADSANPIRTLRHEAVHALRELGFFTDAQWKSLSKMAKDKWIDQYLKQRNVDGKPLKAGEESRYDAYMREYKGDMEKITEEAVADAFADFDVTKPPAGMIQAILQKLRNLFQSIKSALTKMESAEQIFGKVEKGALKPEGKQVKGESKSLRDRATANFNRWFGDSKVVDKNGKPLVVYHGTNKNQQGDAFTQFDTYGSNYGLMGQGSYFTDNADLASSYTKKGRGDTPTVYPVYLSIKNPINMDARGNEAAWQKAFPDVDFNEYSPEGVKNEDYFRAVEEYLTDQQIPRYEGAEAMQDGLRSMGHDGITHRGGARFKTAVGESNTRHQVFIAFDPNQIKSAIGNNGDYSLTNADIRKNLRSQAGKEKSSTEEGQAALNITGGLGRISEPELSLLEQGKKFAAERKEIINDAIENPKATIAEAKATAVRSSDKFQTKTFSSDAAINNSINRSVNEFIKDNAEKIGIMLEISQSQVFHADGVATGVMKEGNAVYNKELRKYEIKKDDANLPALFKQIGVIKDKYGLTQAQAELIGHTAFEAKRLKSLVEFNNKVDQEVEAMREEADKLSMGAMQDLINPLADQSGKEAAANALREKANRRFKDKKLIHNMSGTDNQSAGAEISAGNKLFKIIPELNGVVDTWNKMRENIAEIMKDSGLWSEEEVEFLLSNTDYVPFMREDQLEKGKGPKENIRGLMVEAREKKLKGSHRPVNDVFDNMSRWMQYSVNRAVRNRSALALIDTANRFGQAERVKNKSDGENVVRVWRGGKEEFYSMADPYFVDAFTGLESVAIPVWELGTKVANFLRQSIVLNPLFTVAQLPQDSFAAMFTSGLKPQFALQIPARAVKEFAKTLFNRSATNNELKKYGVVGVRDFNAQTARLDAQVYAGMKSAPGIVGKLKNILEHIAMSGDNAVRQATYEAAILQGLSKAEAIEKSFEIWNIRRKGSNPQLAMASQLIPFFGAYLTAQNVALKTITLKSTSPTERNAALGALIGTTASVMTLSLLYSILNGDDEEYLDKPAAIRDRMLMVPGTGGFGIPLRSDLFSIPKIITEHMYLMITDKGYEDGRKFRDSMVNALTNSFFSPTVVPQLIKPGVEVFTNYNFFQGRPLIGEYQKRIEKEFQFNESTSEIAKILGKTGLVSPISVDHLIKGMFGSVGGLVIYMTNPLLHSDPNVEKPTMSTRDMLATIPGASSFISKEKESGLKNDFYVLRDEVEKVTNTLSNLKQRSPEKIAEYIADPDVMAKLTVSKGVQGIDRKLGEIRKAMTRISNLPTSVMDSDEKQEQIKQLREAETTMLKAINVKKLREMAKI